MFFPFLTESKYVCRLRHLLELVHTTKRYQVFLHTSMKKTLYKHEGTKNTMNI